MTIIGYGQRGQAWVGRAARKEWSVRVFDPTGDLEPGHANIVQHDLISRAVEGAELIVLCLPDRLALQRKVTQHIQTLCPPTTLLLVMSDLSGVEDIQGCVKWPEAVLHVQFARSEEVKIFASHVNTADTMIRLEALVQDIGFTPCLAETTWAAPRD